MSKLSAAFAAVCLVVSVVVRHMSHKVAVQSSLAVGNDGSKTILGTTIKMTSP